MQLEQWDAELLVVTPPPASPTPIFIFQRLQRRGWELAVLPAGSQRPACAARLMVWTLWSDPLFFLIPLSFYPSSRRCSPGTGTGGCQRGCAP